MAFKLAIQTENRACASLVSTVDQGTTNATGQMLIYSGSAPPDPQTAPSVNNTLLGTVPLNNPAFAAPSNGTSALIVSPVVTATVTTSGTASWFRVVDRDGNAVFDGSIGTSGAEINFANVNFVQGGTVDIDGLSITVPM